MKRQAIRGGPGALQLTGSGRPMRPSGLQWEPPITWAVTGSQAPPAPHRGFRGSSPGRDCEPWRRRLKGAEDRATPGGYGGKPPGVAIIGVPTGARNAGRCSDGGPEHQSECYYDSPHDASNPEHNRVACACSGMLLNVAGTPDVSAL